MATIPFTGPWSPNVEFSGNAVFALDASGTIWLAANSTVSGAALYSSSNDGASFTLAVEIPYTFSATLAFDPAIAIDASGGIHIIGQVGSIGNVTLEKYTYQPSSQTLSGPFVIDTNGIVGSDYDIVCLSNGNCYIATSLLTATTETVEGLEIGPTGAVTATDTLVSQAFAVGNRYGAVSLWSADGATVEIYVSYCPKLYTFTDITISIAQIIRSADVVAAPTVLYTVTSRFMSDKLTVIGDGDVRYLAQAYYSQVKATLSGNFILGYQATASTNSPWQFQTYSNLLTPPLSPVEPTLSLSPSGLVLGLISADLSNFQGGAPVVLFNVTAPISGLVPRTDFPYPGLANWLRSSKSILPATMGWGFLTEEASGGVGRFYTGAQLPPVAEVTPATETCQRGIPYTFDASASYDPNMEPITFGWVLTDPTGLGTLTFNGSSATVTLPFAIGPAAQTVTLTVTVYKTGASPSTASAVLTYPLIAPPVIASLTFSAAARNTQVVLAPTVTLSPYVTATYSWAQTAGTEVNMVPTTINSENLSFNTAGALVTGETLTFTLTVSDGLNTPVTGRFGVTVAARPASGETGYLNYSAFNGVISQRNTAQVWPATVASSFLTGFTRTRRAPVIGGQEGGLLLIGPASVGVVLNDERFHVLTPVPTDTILDAALYALDETIVLTSAQELLQFLPASTIRDTDNASGVISLSDSTTFVYERFTVTPPFAGQRVFVLYGVSGVLLLQVNDAFAVSGALELSAAQGTLYGASNVQFVRFAGIENLHSGILLVGTSDNAGNDYETEFSLANRTITATRDSSQLQNQAVATGELLFVPQDSYSGVPTPPVLTVATSNAGIVLSWTQSRSDLVSGYIVSIAQASNTIYVTVGSGQIGTLTLNYLLTIPYSISITAQSLDGPSEPSNVVTITA